MFRRRESRKSRQLLSLCTLSFACILAAAPIVARAQQPTPDAAKQSPQVSKEGNPTSAAGSKMPVDDYTVSPEDMLDIQVMDVPELSRTYQVSANGMLTLPLLPAPIPVAGQTLDQLSRLIAARFRDAGMINNAQVTVALKETKLHTVLVSGEVKRPQAYPIYGSIRLLDLIVQAGGLSEDASSNVIVARGEAGERADVEQSAQSGEPNPSIDGHSFTLNIRRLLDTGDDKANVDLYPGDRITVPRAPLIYIVGAVSHPGGYVLNESRQRITVVKALALAGDVTNIAKKGHITILRHDPAVSGDKRDEIPVNYKAILKGEVADIRLKPDDIVYVPESGGVKAWRAGVSAAVSMATMSGAGLMIYR